MVTKRIRITVDMPISGGLIEQSKLVEKIGGDFDIFRGKVLKLCPSATFDVRAMHERKSSARLPAPADDPAPAEQQEAP